MDLSRHIGSLLIRGTFGLESVGAAPVCRDIVDFNLGGVILFNRCLHTPAQPANIISPTQLNELCSSLHSNIATLIVPTLMLFYGWIRRLRPEAGFADSCSARQLGITGERTSLTNIEAETTAAMLAVVGINCNFAPVVDLLSNPSNPVIGGIDRSFSEDPMVVARHAAVWIEAHRGKGVLSCIKHFPGHGSSAADSHLGFVDVSDSWQPLELEPYRLLLGEDRGDLVMTGHLFNRQLDPDHPATLSAAIIDGLLRSDLGYEGVVVSDDMQMKAITDHYSFEEAVCRSLAAGVDMLVFGNNLDYGRDICPRAIRAIENGLDRGTLSETRLREALGRVEHLKQRLGKNHD